MDNPQAFPKPYFEFDENGMPTKQRGMTLRDYFAGQALVGLISRLKVDKLTNKTIVTTYEIADAMLKERIKNGTDKN